MSKVAWRLAEMPTFCSTAAAAGPSACALSGTDYNLVVGGNLTNVNNTLTGSLFVGGNANWIDPSITGGVSVNGNGTFYNGSSGGSIGTPVHVAGTYVAPSYFPANSGGTTVPPVDFVGGASYLTSESNYLATQAATGSFTFQFVRSR